jgi:hypothetical protein
MMQFPVTFTAVVLLVFAATGIFLGPIQAASKPDQASDVKKERAAKRSLPSTTVLNNNYESSRTPDKNADKAEDKPHWYAGPEWWLVIGAFLGLGFVAWQALETRRAVESANKNVETFISKERARVTINLEDLSLVPDEGECGAYMVNFTVSIFGTTPAFVTESKCVAYVVPQEFIADEEIMDAVMHPLPSLPNVISPGSEPNPQFAIFHFAREGATEAIMNEVKVGRHFVGIRGFIKYKDAFDRERETNFRYVWKYSSHTPGVEWGNWEKCGKEEENKET